MGWPLCHQFSLRIFNEFDHFANRRRVFARWSPAPGPGRDPRTKTLRPLGHMSNPLNIQRGNRWQRGKPSGYSLKRLRLRDLIKGKTYLGPKTFKNPSKINFGHWFETKILCRIRLFTPFGLKSSKSTILEEILLYNILLYFLIIHVFRVGG